jgi:hypothetical protein
MKFLTTYLQPGEEVRYRARIHIFLFLQLAILLRIGFMCYFDDFRITHYLGVHYISVVAVTLHLDDLVYFYYLFALVYALVYT